MRLFDTKTGMEVISEAESVALMAQEVVGRIAVVSGGRPEIFPVNYAVSDAGVVFRTAAGTKLAAALDGPVAFEVDHVDPITRAGWSVVVHGRAETVDRTMRPDLQRALESLPVEPWASGPKDFLVRIVADRIGGRRVGPAGGD